MGILHLGERQRLRLFVRRDTFGRFLSCLVFVPRDRFNTENRRRIETHPARRLPAATHRLHDARLGVGARAAALPGPHRARPLARDARPARARAAARRGHALLGRRPRGGADRGARRGARQRALPRATATRSPPAYRADWVARSALADIAPHRAACRRTTASAMQPLPPARGAARRAARQAVPLGQRRCRSPTCCRCSRTWASRSATSARTRSRRRRPRLVWIYDFGLTYAGDGELDADGVREAFQDALRPRLARRRRERRLQPARPARRADLARGHGPARGRPLPAPGRHDLQRRLRGAGADRPPATSRGCSCELFEARFDPARHDAEAARTGCDARSARPIDAVESLDQDRILRQFLDGDRGDAAHQLLPARRRRRAQALPVVQARPAAAAAGCRCRARGSRSSSTRRASRACTCAAARSRAAASAGRTGARTSAPRCSA